MMLVVLHTKSRHGRAQRIQLRAHQAAKFGRSEWADYSFSNDLMMADMHFEVRCIADGCRLDSLSSEVATKVNGEEVEGSILLNDGDELEAGTTVFVVAIEGAAHQREEAPITESEPEASANDVGLLATPTAVAAGATLSLVAACSFLELAQDVQDAAEATPNTDDLTQELAQKEQFQDALRIRAFLLPKREAVWWGCVCVKDAIQNDLEPLQQKALQAATAWVIDPTEELRREAEDASNTVRNQGSGGMLALAAFWSEGSIGPAAAPHVPADDRLVCQGVSAALITAAYTGNADLAAERLREFVEKGKLVGNGELPIPDPESQ